MKVTKKELAIMRSNPDIEGVFTEDGQLYVDRRYNMEAVERLDLSPRTADLNIIGPAVVRLYRVTENISPDQEGDV